MSATVSPFVGRESELSVLAARLEAARAGNGSVAMLVGEPGIGKTRTAREFAALASQNGACVIWGTCHEAEWTPAFAPWLEAADQLLDALQPAELERRLASAAPALAEIVPALRSAFPDLPSPAALAPEEARHRAYDAFTRLLVRSEEPLVVVLDDLQWADTASIELLRYVGRFARTSKLLLVGAYRDVEVDLSHPLSRCLADLDRQLDVERVRLNSLGASETTALIELLHGAPLAPQLAGEVWRETAGNPFFITEVVRGFGEAGDRVRVPDSVRQAVSSRLRRLSPGTVNLLSVAAAFAGPFGFPVLQALSDGTEEELLDSLDEALRARMIHALEGERYDFAHALVREALYSDLSPSRKARLHRRIARALEDAYAGRERAVAAELASQYSRSRSLPGAEHGVPYAIAAAEQARGASAHDQAVSFLRMARELAASGDGSVLAEIECRLATAEAEALLVEQGQRSLDGALDVLEDAGTEAHALAELLVDAVWAILDAGGAQPQLEAAIRRALALLGERRDLTWARLELAITPMARVPAGPVNTGRWLGFDPEAVRVARASGDELDYARTIAVPEWRTRRQVEELLSLADGWRNPVAKAHLLSVGMRSLMLQHGDIDAAVAVCRRLLALADEVGAVASKAFALTYLADADAARGDFAEAAKHEREAYDVIARLGRGHTLHQGIHFFRHPDEPDWEHVASVHRARACDRTIPGYNGLWHAAVAASAYARAGKEAEVRELLGHVVPAVGALPATEYQLDGVVGHSAQAVFELEATDLARPLLEAGLAIAEAGAGGSWLTPNQLTLARMHALLGDRKEAERWFAEARRVLEARGQRPLRAVVDYDEALARVRSGEPGAARLLAGARETFAELGMTYWLGRAEQLAARLGDGAARPAGLTRRELEILRLVAAGRSSREIADTLVLSVHTVTRHVANVYRKIGAHNRAEATAFVLGHGLASDARARDT